LAFCLFSRLKRCEKIYLSIFLSPFIIQKRFNPPNSLHPPALWRKSGGKISAASCGFGDRGAPFRLFPQRVDSYFIQKNK